MRSMVLRDSAQLSRGSVFCHTERKRNIHKFKAYFKFLWIFLLRLRLATRWVANAQNDNV